MKKFGFSSLFLIVSLIVSSQTTPITGTIAIAGGSPKFILKPEVSSLCSLDIYQKAGADIAEVVAISVNSELNSKKINNLKFEKTNSINLDTLPYEIPTIRLMKMICSPGPGSTPSNSYIFGNNSTPVCNIDCSIGASPVKPKFNKERKVVETSILPTNFDYVLIIWPYRWVYDVKVNPDIVGSSDANELFTFALYNCKNGEMVFNGWEAGENIYKDNDFKRAYNDMCSKISKKIADAIESKLSGK